MGREENIARVAALISRGLQERQATGVSLNAIAAKAGVSGTRLSRLSRGLEGLPKPDFLEKIAPYIGISYSALMDASGYLPPKVEVTDDDPLPPELQAEWDELQKDMKLLFKRHLQGELTPREIRMILRTIKELAKKEDLP